MENQFELKGKATFRSNSRQIWQLVGKL